MVLSRYEDVREVSRDPERFVSGRDVLVNDPLRDADSGRTPDAGRSDVGRRTAAPHLAFGFGEHVCPGSSLARPEARVFFEELLARHPRTAWSASRPIPARPW